MSEFKPDDPAVRDLAAIFALKGWKWGTKDGHQVEPFVPKAKDIAANLSHLLDVTLSVRSAICECPDTANETAECSHPLSNNGSAQGGRLFVEWIDEGYGPEITFGLAYYRSPFDGYYDGLPK